VRLTKQTVAGVVLILIVVACGDSDPSPATGPPVQPDVSTTAATVATTTPGVTPAPSSPLTPGVTSSVVIDGTQCTSTLPASTPGGAIPIEITNRTTTRTALVMGTYNEGYRRDDLVAYGRDISTRPPFIEALEIYEVPSQTTRQVSFDHGPGRYFTACMDTNSTMTVLDDLQVGD
jgi:hypothetical protein